MWLCVCLFGCFAVLVALIINKGKKVDCVYLCPVSGGSDSVDLTVFYIYEKRTLVNTNLLMCVGEYQNHPLQSKGE